MTEDNFTGFTHRTELNTPTHLRLGVRKFFLVEGIANKWRQQSFPQHLSSRIAICPTLQHLLDADAITTPVMLVMILTNICTLLDLFNCVMEVVAIIVVKPAGKSGKSIFHLRAISVSNAERHSGQIWWQITHDI